MNKKSACIAALLIFTLNGLTNAQDVLEAKSFKHEAKLDIFWVLGSTVKIGYEYWLNNRSSLAFSAGRDFSSKPEFQTEALAGYKLYFVKFKEWPWLFAETDWGYTNGFNNKESTLDDMGIYYYAEDGSRYHAFTVGLSLGVKFFVPETNIGLEMIVGANRLYGKESDVAGNFSLNMTRRF